MVWGNFYKRVSLNSYFQWGNLLLAAREENASEFQVRGKNCGPKWEKSADQYGKKTLTESIFISQEKSFLLRSARFKPAEMKTWRCKWRKGEALRAVGNEGIQEWAKLLKYTGRFLMPWKWRLLNWTSNKVPVKICQQSILRNHDCWSILASHLSANFFPIHGRFFLFSPKVWKWPKGEKSLQNLSMSWLKIGNTEIGWFRNINHLAQVKKSYFEFWQWWFGDDASFIMKDEESLHYF